MAYSKTKYIQHPVKHIRGIAKINNLTIIFIKHIPNLVQHCHIRNSMHIENAAKDFAKIVNGLNFFAKTFCLRYLIGLWTRVCINKLYTAQKMKFSIKDFSSKYDQMRSFLRIWSHLLEKYLMENFIFCAVQFVQWL